ncbi:MAG: Rieske (2Fe-2S) protein [Verrucomicrobiia bacterium]
MSKATDKNNPPSTGGVSRQTFLRAAVGSAGVIYAAGLAYPVYRYVASPVEKAAKESAVTEVTLKDAQKLAPGSALMFKFGSKPSMLIHHNDGTWTALTAVCTHLGCTVHYQEDKKRIHCACHGGVYDPKTGANVSGPPPKPLKRYEVKVTDAAVIVSRSQDRA